MFESSMTVVADHQVRLVITSVRGGGSFESGTPEAIDQLELAGCKLGDVGLYTMSISADGPLLTPASDGDACPSREAVLARTWVLGQLLATICLDRRHPTSEGAIGGALAAAQEAAPRFGLVAAAPDLYGCLDRRTGRGRSE